MPENSGRIRCMEGDRRLIEQLTRAVERRTTIGKALGILMERLAIRDDQAFVYLARCSQQQDRKLYDVAAELVETRRLPRHPAMERSPMPEQATVASPALSALGMVGVEKRCAFTPCSRQVGETLRLLRDGSAAVMPTCQRHTDWLQAFIEETPGVQLVAASIEQPRQHHADDPATG
jgi:hypothetical protein